MCLLDYTDFPTADPGVIQLPAGHGFWLVMLCSSLLKVAQLWCLALLQTPTITSLRSTVTKRRTVSATAGGTGISFTNSLSADTDGGHINMKLTEFTSVCNVSSFDFSLDREQIETTSLSCGCSSDNNGLASFKTYQAGFHRWHWIC